MTEQFSNFAQSSLAAPITASQTTISVASPTTFPTLGNFRIVVQSFDATTQIPTSAAEIMLVTAVAGKTFTVQRGAENTTAIAFASGAQVTHIVTAAVMTALTNNSGTPGGTSGQVQYNASGSFGGFTFSGDGTVDTATGILTVTKSNNVSFGSAAFVAIGTSGATIPLLSAANTWTLAQTFTANPVLSSFSSLAIPVVSTAGKALAQATYPAFSKSMVSSLVAGGSIGVGTPATTWVPAYQSDVANGGGLALTDIFNYIPTLYPSVVGPIAGVMNEVVLSDGGGGFSATNGNFVFDGSNTMSMSGNFVANATGSLVPLIGNVESGGTQDAIDAQLNGTTNWSVNAGKVNKYNSVATAGWGNPAIYGQGRFTAQVAAKASVAAYTVGAADGSFMVSANVNVTTATAHSFTVTCTYTDETNTSRTLTLSFAQLAGTIINSITNVTGAGPYEGLPMHIRCKASTTITIATTGTFTTVAYNVEGVIQQIA